MRIKLFQVLASMTVAATLVQPAISNAEPVVRDHRRDHHDRANNGPRAAPPPPRAEPGAGPRRGEVWTSGNWEWRDGQWEWQSGHWEKERPGRRWRPHRWDQKGDVWVRIDGDWIDAPPQSYPESPSQPPPPEPRESPQSKQGYVWISGYFRWLEGRYQWIPGRLEAVHAGDRYIPGQWTLRGDKYVYNGGSWVADVPTSPPPPEPNERPQARPGYAWISGYYRWGGGKYQWTPGRLEAGHPGERFVPGQWTLRSDKYVYNSGFWAKDAPPPPPPQATPPPPPPGPKSPPPPPREERYEPHDGFIWARGHYEWRGNNYEWLPGHWERQRARLTWYDPKWELHGSIWVLIPGGWR